MPLFEYVCRECQHQFETLVTRERQPACPSCHGRDLEKQLSVFAVSTGSGSTKAPSQAFGPCGSCGDPRGPGSCSIN